MRFRGKVADFVMEHANTLRDQNAELPKVTADGTHNYHQALNI